jgi:hypothetical protein
MKAVRTHGSHKATIAAVCVSAMVASLLAAAPAPATTGCTTPPTFPWLRYTPA